MGWLAGHVNVRTFLHGLMRLIFMAARNLSFTRWWHSGQYSSWPKLDPQPQQTIESIKQDRFKQINVCTVLSFKQPHDVIHWMVLGLISVLEALGGVGNWSVILLGTTTVWTSSRLRCCFVWPLPAWRGSFLKCFHDEVCEGRQGILSSAMRRRVAMAPFFALENNIYIYIIYIHIYVLLPQYNMAIKAVPLPFLPCYGAVLLLRSIKPTAGKVLLWSLFLLVSYCYSRGLGLKVH